MSLLTTIKARLTGVGDRASKVKPAHGKDLK